MRRDSSVKSRIAIECEVVNRHTLIFRQVENFLHRSNIVYYLEIAKELKDM